MWNYIHHIDMYILFHLNMNDFLFFLRNIFQESKGFKGKHCLSVGTLFFCLKHLRNEIENRNIYSSPRCSAVFLSVHCSSHFCLRHLKNERTGTFTVHQVVLLSKAFKKMREQEHLQFTKMFFCLKHLRN